jgi:type I restriction enzyme R subunit
VKALQTYYEQAKGMFHGFDYSAWLNGAPAQRLALIPAGQEHILSQQDGKKRFVAIIGSLSKAFALCATSDFAKSIRDEVSFFQAIQAQLTKRADSEGKDTDLEAAIQQLVSRAVVADGQVIDVFAAAGLKKPDISILSEEFLKEVQGIKHKNVAAELLAKLLTGEIKLRSGRNAVQGQRFSEMLKKTLNAYHNRAIATQEVLEELLNLAREVRTAAERGEKLKMTEEEIAFYDALANNESAVRAMGDDKLKVIAAELVTKVRQSTTIDWTMRESAKAAIRVMVKRILRQYGYPPDFQDAAVQTILLQAELLCKDWAA